MSTLELSMPKFGFIVATRAALAFGGALLLSSRIPEPRRQKIGGGLLALGVLTTIPALLMVRRSRVAKPASS